MGEELRPPVDRSFTVSDAGQAVRYVHPARIDFWLEGRGRPRVPSDVLRKQFAKVLVHGQQVDHLGQTSGRVPEGFPERGPEKPARRPALSPVHLRQPEQSTQACPRYRLGTIAHIVE